MPARKCSCAPKRSDTSSGSPGREERLPIAVPRLPRGAEQATPEETIEPVRKLAAEFDHAIGWQLEKSNRRQRRGGKPQIKPGCPAAEGGGFGGDERFAPDEERGGGDIDRKTECRNQPSFVTFTSRFAPWSTNRLVNSPIVSSKQISGATRTSSFVR